MLGRKKLVTIGNLKLILKQLSDIGLPFKISEVLAKTSALRTCRFVYQNLYCRYLIISKLSLIEMKYV